MATQIITYDQSLNIPTIVEEVDARPHTALEVGFAAVGTHTQWVLEDAGDADIQVNYSIMNNVHQFIVRIALNGGSRPVQHDIIQIVLNDVEMNEGQN